MSRLSDFFAALERVLFELVTWVVLVPKTLYLVLSHPSRVPEYVKGELDLKDEKRAQFEGSVSPVFLFLLVAIGPLLLIRVVIVPRVPIEGETIGVVDSAYTFRANFEDVEESYYSRMEWTVWRIEPDGNNWSYDVRTHCYEGRTFLVDCDYAEGVIAWDMFVMLVEDGLRSVPDAHADLTEMFSPQQANTVASYWCEQDPDELDLEACSGPAGGLSELEDVDVDVLDQFIEAVDGGSSADEARERIAGEHGEYVASQIYDYWCAPPPGAGCEVPAYTQFDSLVTAGWTVEEAREAVAQAHGAEVAAEIADYWCTAPPDIGCESRVAWDRFGSVVSSGRTAEEAQRVVAFEYDQEVADQIFAWWCSPPPGEGCAGVESADDLGREPEDLEMALDRFAALLEEGVDGTQARDEVAAEFGDEMALEVSQLWCEFFDDRGCNSLLVSAEIGGAGAPSIEMSSVVPDGFIGDTISLRWADPGTYRISLSVYDMETESLIDLSRDHEIDVRRDLSRTKVGNAQGAKNNTPQQSTGVTETREEKIKQWLQSPATVALALAFLAFPLILTLATELRRGRPLTQATIKPAFYIQCLYLSPFVVSIWIPSLMLRYSPRAETEFELAVYLAVVIFLWLVITEVGFVSVERSASRAKAILWLAVPVAFICASLFVALVVAGLHKYTIVELAGRFVMALMLLPILASGAARLWRRIFGAAGSKGVTGPANA